MRVTESFDKNALNCGDCIGLRYISRMFPIKFRAVQCAGSLG
jgi:hypothetical protein